MLSSLFRPLLPALFQPLLLGLGLLLLASATPALGGSAPAAVVPPAKQQYFDSLRTAAAQAGQPDSMRMHTMYKLALGWRRISRDSARAWADRTMALARRLGSERKEALCLGYIGALIKDKGDFATALRYQLRALRIHEKVGNRTGQISAYNDIGLLHKNLKQWAQSLESYQQARAIAEELIAHGANPADMYDRLAYVLNNIGTVYFDQGKFAEARPWYEQALAQARRSGSVDATATALTNLGGLEAETKHYVAAAEHFREALVLDEREGNLYGQASDLLVIGEMETFLGQYPAAERALSRARAAARQFGDALMQKEIQLRYSRLYARTGDADRAGRAYERYIQLSDSLFSTESTQQMAQMRAEYGTERAEQTARVNSLKLAEERLTLRKRTIQLVAALVAALAASVIGWLLLGRARLRAAAALAHERADQQRAATAAVIEAEERERRRIGADLHDSVGQLLSVVKLNLSGLEHTLGNEACLDKPAQELLDTAISSLDESLREVRTISHQLVPNALIRQGLAGAVRELVQKLSAPVAGLRISLDAIGLERRLPPLVEGVLYRVVQELVANVVKHARADEVTLQLVHHGPELTVLLEDNGVGFDLAEALARPEAGIGLRNLYSRIEYLGGRLDIDARAGRGTIVTIEVPVEMRAPVATGAVEVAV
ncbi:MAG: tetratricopeptide repeat protein [Hymenobacteraceae bacterium]|nr:tetratricopeptide repeat protein [Hymenobacteraceae bacterium]